MPNLIPVDHDPFSQTVPVDNDPFNQPSLWDKGRALMKPVYESVGKPVMEGLGAGGGAIAGIPFGPMGMLAGGTLGYAGVKGLEKTIDVGSGQSPKETYGQSFNRTGKDLAQGAMSQATGMIIPQAAQSAMDLGKSGLGKILPKDLGQRLYQKTLKVPPTLLTPKERVKVTATALREKIPINQEGYDTLMSRISDLDKEVDEAIEARYLGQSEALPGRPSLFKRRLSPIEMMGKKTPVTGVLIDRNWEDEFVQRETGNLTVSRSIREIRPANKVTEFSKPNTKYSINIQNVMDDAKRAVGKQGGKLNQTDRMKAVNEYLGKFYKEWDGNLDLLNAQSLKKDTNRQLEGYFNAWKKGEFGPKHQAETDAINGIREGLKNEIERLAPEVKNLNKRMGDLLNLQPHLMRRINGIENANPITLSEWLATGLGEGLGGGPGAAIGFTAKKMLGHPSMVSRYGLKVDEWQNNPKMRLNFWDKFPK